MVQSLQVGFSLVVHLTFEERVLGDFVNKYPARPKQN